MIDPSENLSPAGMARREAILHQTLQIVRRRRRRRQALQLTAGLAVVVLASVLIRLPQYPREVTPLPGGGPAIVDGGSSVPLPRPPGPVVQVIAPDPDICTRLAAPDLPPTWRTIDDDQLLAALAETGHPAGLVRVAGQTLLMTQ